MFKNVTIKDIALLVGVSTATVSYYLNGNYKKMSVKTREKIAQAIATTGYQPSQIARSLVTKDTQTIGVVIADITNPFISSVMKGIHDTCKQFGYSVNFTNSDNDVQLELENLNRLSQQNVSGIILDSVDANHQIVHLLDRDKVVMVDRQSKTLEIDTVVADNYQSTRSFLRLMKQKGYKRIYFVSFPIEGISTREIRYQAFCDEVSDDVNRLIILGQDNVRQLVDHIIETSHEKVAFFTMNGPSLLTFMKLMHQSKYHYPTDYGLGSYEDLEWMEVLNPNVSCIQQDSYRIGQLAAQTLLDKLSADTKQAPQLLEVKSHIIERHSF
ncbi:LacI family DNA-binding transcriptional regulator [Streptococcus sp. zg-JUN1979]|uniref:LacI family DNA-binding transcriptional regulator n=1 Tax=Streptococcus sp. zg-JUN1979 TaxID=3391450 RepID=UPI0039A45446